MKPIFKNPFCRLLTINDLSVTSLLSFSKDTKSYVKILIIDDQSFEYLDEMRNAGYSITSIKDIEAIDMASSYHIIITDVRGVGKALRYKYEGVGLTNALRQRFPHKEYGVYTGNNVDIEMTQLLTHVEIIPKSLDKDSWDSLLDKLVKRVVDPKVIWEKMRQSMIEDNIPLLDILLLEHKYVFMLNNGQKDFSHFFDKTPNTITEDLKTMFLSITANAITKFVGI